MLQRDLDRPTEITKLGQNVCRTEVIDKSDKYKNKIQIYIQKNEQTENNKKVCIMTKKLFFKFSKTTFSTENAILKDI